MQFMFQKKEREFVQPFFPLKVTLTFYNDVLSIQNQKFAFFKKRQLCLKLLDLMSAEKIGKISDNMELNIKGKDRWFGA